MLRTAAAVLAAAGLACAAAPAAQRSHPIAPGVTVGGIPVGGLTSEPARERILAALQGPIPLARGPAIDPRRLGATADVDAAVGSALAATSSSRIAVPVRYSPQKLAATVAALARRYDRAPAPARVVGATATRPQFSAARDGVAVDRAAMRDSIAQALALGRTSPLPLLTRPVAAHRTVASFGPVIVVTRGVNTLRLYDGKRLVRTFPVGTGQAIYPTPDGIWRVVDKQLNPWWYPPTQDAWAKELKPVPPGPSNPLGTRWMGLSAPGVGIHGTDADTSIGYSASHGCIRMHVPDAEWLFERVHVGTPVVILSAERSRARSGS